MDNKLSERSKPVGYFIEWQDEETGEKEWCECSKQNGAPLYSQEYVSALLAELERYKQYAKERDAENESLALTVGRLRVELEAKTLECRGIEQERELFRVERTAHQQYAQELERRVAELSELETQAKVWESAVLKHLERAEEAEKRLATPVRLPRPGFVTCSGERHYTYGADEVKGAIRAAGFKFVGDE